MYVQEAQQAPVRRFGLLALIHDQIFEVEKLAVEVRAFDHEGLAERHAAQEPALGQGGAIERNLPIDIGHGLEVFVGFWDLARSAFQDMLSPQME